MGQNHNILIITYYWPPSGGVGVQRWMNFALQLKSRGWNPMILTPENPQFEIRDEQLVKRVDHIPVIHLPIWEPFDLFHAMTGNKDRKNVQQGLVMEKSKKSLKDQLMVWIRGNLFVPDPRVFWVRRAAKKAIELVKKNNIGCIITTGPPHSMHLIGRRIKRKTGVRWLADFRDPWSQWDVIRKLNTTPLVLHLHRKLEHRVLKEADVAVTVSKRLADSLGHARVLHNGATLEKPSSITPDSSRFTLGYFGMLNELRNPRQLWHLLDQMCRESQVFADRLHVRIGGIVAESIQQEIKSLKALGSRVDFLGYLPHESLQDEYSRCNVLLLLLNKSDNSKWILPVKFFEYLAAGRMILALGERKSDLGDLMKGRDIGELLGYEEIADIRSFIQDVFEHERKPDQKDIQELTDRFSHEILVTQLEQLLEKNE